MRDARVFESEAAPVAVRIVAEVLVNARLAEHRGDVVAHRCRGDEIKPAVVVDVDHLHIAVVRRVEHALATSGVRSRAVLRGAIHEHAVLVHEQNVTEAALNRARELAHAYKVNVAVLVKIAPTEVLLKIVVHKQARHRDKAGRSLVDVVHELGGR